MTSIIITDLSHFNYSLLFIILKRLILPHKQKMKILPKPIGLLLMLFLLWSCNDSKKKSSPKIPDSKEISETQNYIIDDLGIFIEWTAYKYTDKIGVSGTFEEYSINKKNVSGSIEDVLNGLEFSIATESIDTRNAARDFKIKTYFFEAFNTPTITGTISKAKDGEGVIRLKMNNISYNTLYTYSIENDDIVIFT